jgi:hypothetical protein
VKIAGADPCAHFPLLATALMLPRLWPLGWRF